MFRAKNRRAQSASSSPAHRDPRSGAADLQWLICDSWQRSVRQGAARSGVSDLVMSEALESRRLLSAGDLDPTFGSGGTIRFPYVSQVGENTTAHGVIAQPDGKVILVGSTDPRANGNTDFLVARFNADGSLDKSFGLGGVARTDVSGGGADVAYGVIVGANGKITVVGSTVEGFETEIGVVRYNPNGSLDTTFSGDGIRSTGYAGREDVAYDVLIDAAGKLVLAGASGSDFLLARLNTNGTNDTTFNGDGLDLAGFGGVEAARGVALLPNGQIVASGFTRNGVGGSDFAAVLYGTNGLRVSGFGDDGKRKVDIGGANDVGWGVAVDSVGRILLGGTTNVDGFPAVAAVRLNPTNAAFDSTFGGGDGIATSANDLERDFTPVGGGVFIAAGNAVTVGGGWTFESFPSHSFRLARFTSGGAPDTTFSAGQREGSLVALAPAPGGKFLVASRDFSVTRYNADGPPDFTFGEDGASAHLPGRDGARDIAFLPDGRAVIAASYLDDISLVRYTASGAVDTNFGTNGRVIVALPQTSDDPEQRVTMSVRTIEPHTQGGFLVAGTLFDLRAIAVGAGVVRFNADGSLDTTFAGGDGILRTFGSDDSGFSGFRVQPDGKFILVDDDANFSYFYNRYNANGTDDPTVPGFSFDPGEDQLSFGPIIEFAPDGKLIGGGTDDGTPEGLNEEGPTTVLFRLNANWTLDTSFSGDGYVTDLPGNLPGDELPGDARIGVSAAAQPDGKIVFVYQHDPDSEISPDYGDVGVVRLNVNGTLDTSFGNGGTTVLDFGQVELPGSKPLIQLDGRILISAEILPDNGNRDADTPLDVGFARLTPTGQLDSSFGTGGRVVHRFGNGEWFIGLGPITGNEAMVLRTAPFGATGFVSGNGFAISQLDVSLPGTTDPTTPFIAIQNGVLVGRGTGGADTITVRRTGSDDVIVQINGTSKQFDMDNFAGGVRLEGLGGNDRITVVDSLLTPVARRVTLDGGAGNDTLTGNNGADLILGGAGDDTLVGGVGNDTLDGGDGDDFADGGSGTNTHRSIERFPGAGTASIAIVNRVLTANGTGNGDIIRIARTGNDDVIVTIGSLSRQFDMDNFDTVLLSGLGGNDLIAVDDPIEANGLRRKVTMDGGAGNDTLHGNLLDEVLRGGDGDDMLQGGGGPDAIFGHAGNDSLYGGIGQDFLDGGIDNDFFSAVDGEPGDTVLGGDGTDTAQVDAGDEHSSIESFA